MSSLIQRLFPGSKGTKLGSRRTQSTAVVRGSNATSNVSSTNGSGHTLEPGVRIIVSEPSSEYLRSIAAGLNDLRPPCLRVIGGIEYVIAQALIPDKPVQVVERPDAAPHLSLAICQTGAVLATGSADATITLWDFSDGTPLVTLTCDKAILPDESNAPLSRRASSARRASFTAFLSATTAPLLNRATVPVQSIEFARPPSTSRSRSLTESPPRTESPPPRNVNDDRLARSTGSFSPVADAPPRSRLASVPPPRSPPLLAQRAPLAVPALTVGDAMSEEEESAATETSSPAAGMSEASLSVSASTATSVSVSASNNGPDMVQPASPLLAAARTPMLFGRRHSDVAPGVSLTTATPLHTGSSTSTSSTNSGTTAAPPRVVKPGVYAIAFSGDDNYLAVAVASMTEGHVVYIWKLASKKIKIKLRGHSMRINALQFTFQHRSSLNELYSASSDGTVRFWDRSKSKPTVVLKTGSAVMSATLLQEDVLVTGQFSGAVQGWSIGKREMLWTIDSCFSDSPLTAVIPGPEPHTIITYSKDNVARVIRVASKLVDYSLSHSIQKSSSNFTKMAMSLDNTVLAIGLSDGSILVWDLDRQVLLSVVKQHSSPIAGLAWNLGGNLVSVAEDRKLVIWDGRELVNQYLRTGLAGDGAGV
ncbi:hypothetical protein AMAG_01554 [Allomyces macrogynus ATCC 38327]|uniref:Anaphase-promoting complex subunit 4 WD40 domain-containing protein n=1 Tax=Allomyces macrogynus (strain ATCC 38327) TaxID=578462 RepID=A0A0L0RZY4_ALLM3|nr:hypothetical protein AMAG_01554 [Allomyces macrogynus ATCC 38327]|eukprot:KNE55666.1 hypothetical protein AMAG_01554 [Allomyces macrogynus ATCC 38327]